MDLYFKNLPEFNLQKGDKVYVIDNKAGPAGIIFINRKDESKFVSGIYSVKTGELMLSEAEFDEISLKSVDAYVHGYVHGNKSYYQITKDGKVGACTLEGILALEPENMEIEMLYNGVFIVKTSNGKYGAYSECGEELLEAKYSRMKREKNFIIAYTKNNEVSIIFRDKVLAMDVKYCKISVNWYFVYIQKQDSCVLCSYKGFTEEFNGSARCRQGSCLEITLGNQKSIINAITGSTIIPMGEYRLIKKNGEEYFAEKYDGTFVTGKIEEN